MPSKILDTQVLISDWRRARRPTSLKEARLRAMAVIEFRRSNQIASPVVIEFLAGARSAEEIKLYNEFLRHFHVIDRQKVPSSDWKEAERFARWVGLGRERKLGDCLIQAIARRFNCDVITADADFTHRIPPGERA
jgi:predicted nucleic acid-binding protein